MPYFTKDNSILCTAVEFLRVEHFLKSNGFNTVAMFLHLHNIKLPMNTMVTFPLLTHTYMDCAVIRGH